MHPKLKQTPGIYLVGFMGCGKSTVGSRLAQRLGWEFVDLDDEVEKRAAMKISEIFGRRGEAAFRDLEHHVLAEQVERITSGHPLAVALGGGVFVADRNRLLLETAGLSIWLECSVEILWERVRQEDIRPLARDRARFEELYEQRRGAYEKADLRFDAAAAPDEIVAAILTAVWPEAAA
jgi:shikimate kinase